MYKTGASFVGVVQDYKKIGSGVFIWPDGSKYDGDYVNNLRHGKGESSCKNKAWMIGLREMHVKQNCVLLDWSEM